MILQHYSLDALEKGVNNAIIEASGKSVIPL